MKRRIANEIGRTLGKISQKFRMRRARCEAEKNVTLTAHARIYNGRKIKSAIRIGENTIIAGELLVLPHGGEISIGRDSFVSQATHIWSGSSIIIGDRVLISHGVNIHDNDSHSLSAVRRSAHYREIRTKGHPSVLENVANAKVVIENDVWICFNATVLKGVTIGTGAVIAACAVVTHDVEPFAIVAGNPARVVGRASP